MTEGPRKPLRSRIGPLPEVEGEWRCCNGFRHSVTANHPADVEVYCPWCGDGRRIHALRKENPDG